jgi:hypothetical protein
MLYDSNAFKTFIYVLFYKTCKCATYGPDMSGNQVSSIYKGAEHPPWNPSLSTPSLVVAKGSLGDFGSSPLNPFGFLEI